MKFITENLFGASRLEVLTENSQEGRKLYLEGPMVMTNKKNRNGRNYDKQSVGIPAVDRYNEEYVRDRRAIGEVEHPDYPFPKLSKAAIKINEDLHWEGDDAVGKAMVLNNPEGQIIKSLIEADFNMAVSTRGLGDVKEASGAQDVLPGFMLTAVDVVDRPSGQTCYVSALKESIDWEKNAAGVWVAKDVNNNVDAIIKENSLLESDFMVRFKKALSKMS